MLMKEDRELEATQALRRIVEIEKLLVAQIHILETMTPLRFLGFSDQLNPASGFQSMQFREIEFSSGVKDKNILQAFSADRFAYERLLARFGSPSLGDAFYALLRRRGFDTPADDETLAQDERKLGYQKRTHAVVEILTHFLEQYEEFQ